MKKNSGLLLTTITAIITAFTSYFLVQFTVFPASQPAPLAWKFYCFSLIVFLGAFAYWKSRFVSSFEEMSQSVNTIKSYAENHFPGFKGFSPIEEDKVLLLLEKEIPRSNKFYVIGDGYKYLTLNTQNFNSIKSKYYSPLAKRIKGKGFEYKRIAPHMLDDTSALSNHLKACFSNFGKGSSLEVTTVNGYDEVYTYFIIDDRILVLQVIQGSSNIEKNFICTVSETIKLYENHFGNVWNKRTKLKLLTTLNKLNNHLEGCNDSDRGNLTTILNKAIENFDELPANSVIRKIIYSQITSMVSPVNMIIGEKKEGIIRRHSHLDTFGMLITSLKEGQSYSTLSEYNFWENLEPEPSIDLGYMKMNIEALINKATIERYFLIVEDEFKDPSADRILKSLKTHYGIAKNYPGYTFQAVLRNEVLQDEKIEELNFGIVDLKNDREKFLLIPLKDSKNRYDIEMTEISYISDGGTTAKVDEKERLLLKVRKHVKKKSNKVPQILINMDPTFKEFNV